MKAAPGKAEVWCLSSTFFSYTPGCPHFPSGLSLNKYFQLLTSGSKQKPSGGGPGIFLPESYTGLWQQDSTPEGTLGPRNCTQISHNHHSFPTWNLPAGTGPALHVEQDKLLARSTRASWAGSPSRKSSQPLPSMLSRKNGNPCTDLTRGRPRQREHGGRGSEDSAQPDRGPHGDEGQRGWGGLQVYPKPRQTPNSGQEWLKAAGFEGRSSVRAWQFDFRAVGGSSLQGGKKPSPVPVIRPCTGRSHTTAFKAAYPGDSQTQR